MTTGDFVLDRPHSILRSRTLGHPGPTLALLNIITIIILIAPVRKVWGDTPCTFIFRGLWARSQLKTNIMKSTVVGEGCTLSNWWPLRLRLRCGSRHKSWRRKKGSHLWVKVSIPPHCLWLIRMSCPVNPTQKQTEGEDRVQTALCPLLLHSRLNLVHLPSPSADHTVSMLCSVKPSWCYSFLLFITF